MVRTYSKLGCNVMPFPISKIRRKVTDSLAEEIRFDLNMSYYVGGDRYYISEMEGEIITINKLEIFNPRNKNVLATCKVDF